MTLTSFMDYFLKPHLVYTVIVMWLVFYSYLNYTCLISIEEL